MTDLVRCSFTREDGARCVFGANHTVDYHHLDSGANVPVAVPSVPVESGLRDAESRGEQPAMSETEQIEQIKTWLAGRYQDHHIYRGKPKLLAKHAQELLDELVTPLLAERTRERDEARAALAAAEERGDAEARAVNSLREDLRQARAEAVRVMEHGEKLAANLRAVLGRARAKRDQFRDSAVAYAAQVTVLNAELAGLRERAVILTKRVRYAYDGDTWDGWLVTLTVAETGTQATVRRDNGEDWVVMARNITEIEGTPDVPQ